MPITIERVARGQHKQDAMQIDDALLHPDTGEAEYVAHHHHGELDQNHEQGRPSDKPARAIGKSVNPIGKFSEGCQGLAARFRECLFGDPGPFPRSIQRGFEARIDPLGDVVGSNGFFQNNV